MDWPADSLYVGQRFEASTMNVLRTLASVALWCAAATVELHAAESASPASAPEWLTRPLSVVEAVDVALRQNSSILRGKADLEAAYGVVVQTRAIVLPKLRATSGYTFDEAIEKLSLSSPTNIPGFTGVGISPSENKWAANISVVQSIYQGGRINSALRTAKLTKQQALLQYEAVVADTLLDVRVAYYDILLAAQQIIVQEASVNLLRKELEDATRRFEAGTVPRFNVLRAEVEVANARPRLIRAKNTHRITKNNLANLLGYHVPTNVWEEIPLQLTAKLEAEPYEIDLPAAVAQALERRPELGVLRKAERLRKEDVIMAKGGNKPSLELFAGYGARNTSFRDDFLQDVAGFNAGIQLNWDIFDGRLTKGKIQQAEALHERSVVDLDDTTRRVELEVRTAYSNFIEAQEVLESQKKVQEQAEEALRLAASRAEAGTGTQLDVLNAQTSLTEARTTQSVALHDYAVARARLERAIGQGILKEGERPAKP
jgi:outer membrane protein TolC